MTSILEDPVVPDLLPARPAELTISSDVPSQDDRRPFGLTRLEQVPDGVAMVSLDGLTYDPVCQLNVDTAGRPVVETTAPIHAATSYDTRYDMTWVVDKD
ncbi:putative ATP-grasp-modified RiPP [Actinophytocola sp.]|uniref:putative ATP-grasp-modified RiPP n=1 Tax=Actinophytocola sp. TaxID=1872138 RepID=UPI0025BDA957|nr:putative ATP-grasp-modified RiPP [Actinophytocola sp.]